MLIGVNREFWLHVRSPLLILTSGPVACVNEGVGLLSKFDHQRAARLIPGPTCRGLIRQSPPASPQGIAIAALPSPPLFQRSNAFTLTFNNQVG